MTKRIPYVQQLEISDCGAACLAMALKFHGRDVPMKDLRVATGTGRGGVDARALAEAARTYGLRARGVAIEVDELRYLPPGSILHWGFDHFVVFEKATRKGLWIVDPAIGRRHVSTEEVRKSFTGVALSIEPSEEFVKERGSRSGAWRYVKPILSRRLDMTRVLVTSLLIQVAGLAVPIMTGVMIDRVLPNSDQTLLVVLLAGLLAMVLFQMLASFVRAHLLLQLRAQLDTTISFGFIEHLVRLPYLFFLQRSAGDLMMRLNSNATVREILTTGAVSTLLDGSFVALYLILIYAQSVLMGVVVTLLAIVQVTVLVVTQRRNHLLMTETLQAQARSQSYLVQLFAGIEVLKSLGAEDRSVSHWSHLFVDEVNANLRRGRLSAVVDSITGALRIAAPLIILAVGATLVMDNSMSLGTMMAVSALAGGFLTPLANLVSTGTQMQLLGSYMERINDVLDTEAEQDLSVVTPAGALQGGIELQDVTFRYAEGGPDVVANASLRIEPGQSVAIVGRSGSGKSTLAHLLVGLFQPSEGKVLFDGHHLAELEARSVRSQVGIVPQNPFLFGSSIRENIALAAPDATQSAIEGAAWAAAIDRDIDAMPLRYDTVLADSGASLSGGQRQRIALARALVRDPVILVLDEATSALDAVTETQVYENLGRLGCTRIVIAHRLSTIAHADVIVVMEGGRFVEVGTHAELMAARGHYFELVRAQGEREPDRL